MSLPDSDIMTVPDIDTMSVPESGIYTIINAQHNTVASMSSPTGEIFGAHNSGADSHRWTVRRISTNNYTIQNIGFDTAFASCNNIPTSGSNVFGTATSRHWLLQAVGSNIVISSLDAPNLWWSLSSPVNNTPILFGTNHASPNTQWVFRRE